MRKKLKCILSLILVMLLLVTQAFAALAAVNTNSGDNKAVTISGMQAKIDNNKRVTVSGIISAGSGQIITAKVIDPKNSVDYIGSVVSTKNGAFTLSYILTNTNYGTYEVTLSASKVSVPLNTSFSYGTDNNLASLMISRGALSQPFSPDVTEYKVVADNSISRISLVPTASESTSGIKVNDVAVASGKSSEVIQLNEKETLIKINVTSLSGKVKTYTLTVTKDKDNIPSVTATAAIASDQKVTINGALSIGSGFPVSVKVKAPDGKVDYINTAVTLSGGKYEFSYQLTNKNTGRYSVDISAKGLQNTVSTYFYYVKEVSLKSLTISDVKLSPVFSSKVTDYTSAADGSFDTVTLNAAASDGVEKIIINKQEVNEAEASGVFHLRDGSNTFHVTVLAMNGSLSKTYTVNINKAKKVPDITVKAQIDNKKVVDITGNTEIRAALDISVLVTDPAGKPEYANRMKTYADGSYHTSYTLVNKIRGDYKVSIGAEGLSSPSVTYFTYNPNADLSALSAVNVSLTPVFSKDQQTYGAAVENSIVSTAITAVAVDPEAEITINGSFVSSGQNSVDIALVEGVNNISVKVTRMDESKTYYITIERKAKPVTYTPTPTQEPATPTPTQEPATPTPTQEPATPTPTQEPATPTPTSTPLSSDATLRNLKIVCYNEDMLSSFSPDTFEYTIPDVANSVEKVSVMPTVSENHATVAVNGTTVTGSAIEVDLAAGTNVINITVTAQNGSTKTYTVNITIAEPASIPFLSSLTADLMGDMPLFCNKISDTVYELHIWNYITGVAITPTAADSTAKITVLFQGESVEDGTERESGAYIHVILGESNDDIVIKVIHSDSSIDEIHIKIIRDITDT